MGLCALGAIVFIALAYLGQSPQFIRRNRTVGPRLAPRARSFTGYALALLLMGMGFFMAGVPLDGQSAALETAATDGVTTAPSPPPSTLEVAESMEDPAATPTLTVPLRPTSTTPESGSFARPNTDSDEEGAAAEDEPSSSVSSAGVSVDPTATSPPTATPTVTPSPTVTPTPTFTPTPIFDDTVAIDIGAGTIWLRTSPFRESSEVVMLNHEDLVIPTGRRANQAGFRWAEVAALDGQVGWILEEFLAGPADSDES